MHKVKIITAYTEVAPSIKEESLTWYERAHNEALLLSQVFEIPLSKVIGVISALSPNNRWKQNLRDTWNFLENPSLETKVCTFKKQRQKALDILDSNGSDSEIQRILRGHKTINFYHNIKYYKESQRVTVDTWMYRFMGLKPSIKNFKLTELVVQEAANELNILPHQLQAVLWGVIRGGVA